VSVPVNHRPRVAGRSHYGINNRLWVGLVDLLGVLWLRRRSRLPAPILFPSPVDEAPREARFAREHEAPSA
jgi:dolichol-phosphate mannosyltransferase